MGLSFHLTAWGAGALQEQDAFNSNVSVSNTPASYHALRLTTSIPGLIFRIDTLYTTPGKQVLEAHGLPGEASPPDLGNSAWFQAFAILLEGPEARQYNVV